MLKQRVITAVILLLVLLGVLSAPVPWAFGLFMAVVMGCAGWEWARLSGCPAPATYVWAGVAVAGCLGMTALGWPSASVGWPRLLVSLMAFVWLVLGAWLLWAGVPVWQRIVRPLRMLLGLLVLWAAWLAAVQFQTRFGLWYLLSVLALVWVADIAAYFAGRAFGKRKLAPSISPGKSWAGAIGGACCVLLFAVACSLWLPVRNFYADLLAHGGWLVLLVVVLGLSVMSVVGDLTESLIKRSMGMKDSSQLLPGHGGVLDRIDALLPVLPLALAVVFWILG